MVRRRCGLRRQTTSSARRSTQSLACLMTSSRSHFAYLRGPGRKVSACFCLRTNLETRSTLRLQVEEMLQKALAVKEDGAEEEGRQLIRQRASEVLKCFVMMFLSSRRVPQGLASKVVLFSSSSSAFAAWDKFSSATTPRRGSFSLSLLWLRHGKWPD